VSILLCFYEYILRDSVVLFPLVVVVIGTDSTVDLKGQINSLRIKDLQIYSNKPIVKKYARTKGVSFRLFNVKGFY